MDFIMSIADGLLFAFHFCIETTAALSFSPFSLETANTDQAKYYRAPQLAVEWATLAPC